MRKADYALIAHFVITTLLHHQRRQREAEKDNGPLSSMLKGNRETQSPSGVTDSDMPESDVFSMIKAQRDTLRGELIVLKLELRAVKAGVASKRCPKHFDRRKYSHMRDSKLDGERVEETLEKRVYELQEHNTVLDDDVCGRKCPSCLTPSWMHTNPSKKMVPQRSAPTLGVNQSAVQQEAD
ncbi:Hypothetical protein, putative [Bodo saltans]|uniref:Uncharacterized protein n=1 Tax=Bodo saltans TaxID=75058 RepID=A0A0S4J391_BODSA|nr:Hypothetical protein, putative [Bodo saltans]|eukprot:CUG74658.1 Hypothetical protein, putative [Bodo saltans]